VSYADGKISSVKLLNLLVIKVFNYSLINNYLGYFIELILYIFISILNHFVIFNNKKVGTGLEIYFYYL
jgi:hypothetical protein